MKKRKKRAQKQKRKSLQDRLNGFDFGVDQVAMAVSDFQFGNLLHDAKVVACAYGVAHSPEVKANVPMISLAATKIDPLIAALGILQRWDKQPGDDGFSLEFILRRDGGYLLAISPDFKALLSRVNKSDRFFTEFGVNVSWLNNFPAHGSWLSGFRKYVAQRAAPFVFTGCHWVAADESPRPIPGMPEILKFEARFSDEGATVPGSFGHAMLNLRREVRSGRERHVPPRPKQTPEAIRERRAEQLKRHFPVTLWRADDPAFEAFRSRNAALDVREWQWRQANCNLALSIEMAGRPHYPGLSERQLVGAVGQYLVGRIEFANMPSLPRVSDEALIKQVLLDGVYLLKERGCRSIPRAVGDLPDRLAEEGLL